MKPYTDRGRYNERQWALWKLFLDVSNAITFKFDKYRFATPGIPIDVNEARKDIKQTEAEWHKEWKRRQEYTLAYRNYQGSPKFTGMGRDAQLYMHSLLDKWRRIEAESVRPEVFAEGSYF